LVPKLQNPNRLLTKSHENGTASGFSEDFPGEEVEIRK
jgi:hypothetical protein